MVLLRPV